MNCSDSQISWNKSVFNQIDSSLGRHVNAPSHKGLEIKRSLSQNPEPILSVKIWMNSSFQLVLYINSL